jgi:hypothetical protein
MLPLRKEGGIMDFIKGLVLIVAVVAVNVAWVAALVWVAAQVIKSVFA